MRSLSGSALRDALLESRQYTKSLVDDLTDAQWVVPVLPVMQDGRLVGLLTSDNVGEFVMIRGALSQQVSRGGRHAARGA